MIFNIQKFLIENKLTKRANLNEDAMTKTDAEQLEMSDEEVFGDEEEDDWDKPEVDDSAEFEKEPTTKDVSTNEPNLSGIHKKQADLRALEDKKDALLMQFKSGQLQLDQYKNAIGNIPAQIKKLRADISNAMNIDLDDVEGAL
jgi:hypothetical protein